MSNAIRVKKFACIEGPLDGATVCMLESDTSYIYHTPIRVHAYGRIPGRSILIYSGTMQWQLSESVNGLSGPSCLLADANSPLHTSRKRMRRQHVLKSLKAIFQLRRLMG